MIHTHPTLSPVILVLIALMTALEAALMGTDLGLWGTPGLRQMAYDWGGFWPGLLQGWQANYPTQTYVMFISYAFLHGGIAHLAMNMLTLWSLGQAVIERVGTWRFALLYLGTTLGGAGGYGLLANTIQPMVGASGALFGLAGALLAWAYVDRFTAREALWPVAQIAGFLVAINLVMYWALAGQLAWETHLGGFVCGWLLAMLVDPRGRDINPIDPARS